MLQESAIPCPFFFTIVIIIFVGVGYSSSYPLSIFCSFVSVSVDFLWFLFSLDCVSYIFTTPFFSPFLERPLASVSVWFTLGKHVYLV